MPTTFCRWRKVLLFAKRKSDCYCAEILSPYLHRRFGTHWGSTSVCNGTGQCNFSGQRDRSFCLVPGQRDNGTSSKSCAGPGRAGILTVCPGTSRDGTAGQKIWQPWVRACKLQLGEKISEGAFLFSCRCIFKGIHEGDWHAATALKLTKKSIENAGTQNWNAPTEKNSPHCATTLRGVARLICIPNHTHEMSREV